MIKVSVIIPVYNVERYLRVCLDSVVNQTLKDIEIICVDDGSTDGSPAILAEYAAKDPRVRVITGRNAGTVVARQYAIAAARGEWCLFLDPDDWLENDACARLMEREAHTDADILQYGFRIEETESRPAAQRAASEAYFNRPAGRHPAASLFETIYVKRELSWNLIGRCVRTSVCKSAFAEQCKAYSINETDVYAVFHIIAHAKFLEVFEDRLYHYRYGVGISTKRNLDLGEYGRMMGKLETARELKTFAASVAERFPDAPSVAERIGRMMASTLFTSLVNRVPREADRKAGFEMLLRSCPHDLLAAALAERFDDQPYALADSLANCGGWQNRTRTTVARVGIYYFHLTMGGVQRVIAAEMAELRSRGLEVTLFVDDDGSPLELPIPTGVDVVRLPPLMGARPAPASVRFQALKSELESRRIDVFHSHQYLTPRLVHDVVAVSLGAGVPFFLSYHSVCTAALWSQPSVVPYVFEPNWLTLCDGVFTLSGLDAGIFRAEGIRARELGNPVLDVLDAAHPERQDPRDGKTVLWIGRLSPEKHPGDAIRVFAKLHRSDPTLRFILVGGGEEKVVAHLRTLAAHEGVSTVTEFAGSQTDVVPYYARASVLISTSDYEGYSLVAQEALLAGVPVVSYAHPQLPLFRDNPSVVQVRPRDVDGMAAAVRDVLSSDLRAAADRARASVKPLSRERFGDELLVGFEGRWTSDPDTAVPAADVSDFLTLLRRGLAALHARRTAQITALVKERDELRAALAASRADAKRT